MREFESAVEGGARRGGGGIGGGGIARTLTHLGMAAATLAFASWWTTNTVFDSTRTTRIASVVLSSQPLRAHVAEAIAPVASEAVPALLSQSGTSSAPTTPGVSSAEATDAFAKRLEVVLARPDIQAALVGFVGELHDRVIGVASGPAVLDPAAVHDLAAAASPQTPPSELAKLPAVSIDVPNVRPMSSTSRALRSRWPLFALAATALVVAAVAFSRDRRDTVKLVGRWLVGISVGHLLVLYVLPVYIVPRVTKNPWAGLIASVAREVGAGLVTGLVVVAAAGVACLLVDRLIPAADAARTDAST